MDKKLKTALQKVVKLYIYARIEKLRVAHGYSLDTSIEHYANIVKPAPDPLKNAFVLGKDIIDYLCIVVEKCFENAKKISPVDTVISNQAMHEMPYLNILGDFVGAHCPALRGDLSYIRTRLLNNVTSAHVVDLCMDRINYILRQICHDVGSHIFMGCKKCNTDMLLACFHARDVDINVIKELKSAYDSIPVKKTKG